MTKIDGRVLAKDLTEKLAHKTNNLSKKICFIQFGENPVVASFVKRKIAVAQQVGVQTEIVFLPDSISISDAQKEIKAVIDKKYDGVVVQLPLPSQINADEILDLIPSSMDIDLLRPDALGKYELGEIKAIPPVAYAIGTILEHFCPDFKYKKIVILGKGKLVGLPVSAYLKKAGASPEIFDINSGQAEIASAILGGDIIISGIGSPRFLKPHMIREGVVLVDAGTSEQGGKIEGDVDQSCYEKASFYTPVPGGVGPIAVVGLFNNLFSDNQS